jgi:hypothetical protein
MTVKKRDHVFVLLIHAHDHIWNDGGFTLRERIAACQAIWDIICSGAV